MPLTLTPKRSRASRPVHLVAKGGLAKAGLSPDIVAWAETNSFTGEEGRTLLYAGEGGQVAGALFGLGSASGGHLPLLPGALARTLPAGDWHFDAPPDDAWNASLGLLLGTYAFTAYGRKPHRDIRFAASSSVDVQAVGHVAEGCNLARDLINTPTNDMGPDALETAVRTLGKTFKATVKVTEGDALLAANLPMIHAVGRASEQAPRLIDMSWGQRGAPKVTLVGKGVCFDTGGLDIKPASSMLLMKKDMGGAANVLGLAHIVMASRVPVRLRVLIPAVENAIAGNAFRPSDILRSRKGITVEVGNTDAEGRLVLADALALADEEEPQLLVDMATLTGAARVALGADLPPFFTDDEQLAAQLAEAAVTTADPLWRLPLWNAYEGKFPSKVADINNVNTDGFAGAIIAALFLRRFVEKAKSWAHFDIFGWNPQDRPHGIAGGEAQAIRALHQVIAGRHAK